MKDIFAKEVLHHIPTLPHHNTLKILLNWIPTCIIFDELSAVILTFVPVYVMCLFSSDCFEDFLFIANFKKFDYDVPWYQLIDWLIDCAGIPWTSCEFMVLSN